MQVVAAIRLPAASLELSNDIRRGGPSGSLLLSALHGQSCDKAKITFLDVRNDATKIARERRHRAWGRKRSVSVWSDKLKRPAPQHASDV